MQSNSQTIEFTSETTSNGVIERHFVVDDITGVLWSPPSGSVGSPLLLSGHSGGMHKKAPGLVASALHSVSSHGFAVAAIDAPGHGDRPRNTQDEQWVEAIHQARAAHESIAPIVVEYNRSLAERAVPEWQRTIDALQTLPDVDVDADAPIGFGGVSLGVVTGLMLAPVESRIAAVSFGGVFVDDSLIEAARKLTAPVEYRIPWDDKGLRPHVRGSVVRCLRLDGEDAARLLGQALSGARLRARQFGSVFRPPPRRERRRSHELT